MVGKALVNGVSSERGASGGDFSWVDEWRDVGSQAGLFISMFARSVTDSDMILHSYGFGVPPNVALRGIWR